MSSETCGPLSATYFILLSCPYYISSKFHSNGNLNLPLRVLVDPPYHRSQSIEQGMRPLCQYPLCLSLPGTNHFPFPRHGRKGRAGVGGEHEWELHLISWGYITLCSSLLLLCTTLKLESELWRKPRCIIL